MERLARKASTMTLSMVRPAFRHLERGARGGDKRKRRGMKKRREMKEEKRGDKSERNMKGGECSKEVKGGANEETRREERN